MLSPAARPSATAVIAAACPACRPSVEALTREVSALRAQVEALQAIANADEIEDLTIGASAVPLTAAAPGGSGGGSGGGSASGSGPSSPRASHRRGGAAGVPSTTLADGTVLRLRLEELAAMKEVFKLFDEDCDGRISVADLAKLHAKLGEPLTDDEARDAVALIGGGDSISFEDLAKYWDGSHSVLRKGYVEPSELGDAALQMERLKKREWYRAKFKFVRARLPNAGLGRVFTVAKGTCPSHEYRLFYYYHDPLEGDIPISPWHDVPLRNGDSTYNMVVEIPKWTRHKWEIATGELYNPIKQDVKNGRLRDYAFGDMLFNYGALPQTYEDPAHLSMAGTPGDNDPIDAVELGTKQWASGSIVRVKVLGVLGLIDAGETDWKLICISAEDPLAPLLNDLDDVAVHMPGAIDALRNWLRLYKLPVINDFIFDGEPRGADFAKALIDETHAHWRTLVEEKHAPAPEGGAGHAAPHVSIVSAGLRRSTSKTALNAMLGTLPQDAGSA